MYFMSGKSRAFEMLMQGKPRFDRYENGCTEHENCKTATSTVRTGNIGFVYMPSVRMNRQGHFRECGYTPYACCGISFLTTTVDTLRFSKPDEKSISPLWQIVRTIIIAFIRVHVYNKQQRRTDRKWNICLARKPQRNGGSLIGAYKSYVRKIASPGFLALEICG